MICDLGEVTVRLENEHPTLSLASEQTLKDLKNPRGTNVQMRRVDLAN